MGFKFDKSQYRKFCKNRLKRLTKFRAKSYHYKIFKPLLKILKILKARKILLFLPTFYEPNLLILRRNLSHRANLFLPFMLNESLKIVKLRLPFKASKFGLKEAQNSIAKCKRIDVAIIPVIGVDGNLARIGHGFGYYDRFFGDLKYKPVIIFVQIDDFFTNEKICESHDLRGDFYVTPRKIYTKRANYDRDFYRVRCGYCGCRRWIFRSKKR